MYFELTLHHIKLQIYMVSFCVVAIYVHVCRGPSDKRKMHYACNMGSESCSTPVEPGKAGTVHDSLIIIYYVIKMVLYIYRM